MPGPTLAMVGTLAMSGHSPWIIPNLRARSGEGGRGPLPAGGTDCPFGLSEAGRQIQRPHPEAAERSGGFQGTLEGALEGAFEGAFEEDFRPAVRVLAPSLGALSPGW